VLECVVNISEGSDLAVVEAIGSAAGDDLLDTHHDPHHNRSVFTLVGRPAAELVAEAAIERLDLSRHLGVHPRIGVVDVVPFVPLEGSTFADAMAARDAFAETIWERHRVPSFFYGPERTLPDVRRSAFHGLDPDVGDPRPHRTAGAMAVGARLLLVAYNVWLAEPDLASARTVARQIREPAVRALGLQVGERVQVSMNLVDPGSVGPAEAYDRVAALAPAAGAELVGLVPRAVLDATAPERWAALDLGPDRTIEARLALRG
jgi:glutamate formiminotransferase